ncbi:MAG: zinc-dependent peptidase [Xenococcaceae cyanobacterium MO_234.B1]|nr:zinc-dependent peptidase [Xenococcaceae cyanobacterium MO_234.B1]
MPALIQLRRQRIKNQPFPLHWETIIQQNLPIYKHFSPPLRKRLQGHVNVILAEKQFVGCGGLQITEEIKLTIAALAALLLLNERGDYYPKLASILVYPSAYVVNQAKPVSNYVMEETKVVRLGESWNRDLIVLSWSQIKYDTQNWQDGHNVILHEFAHQLDNENGTANGVPILEHKSDYATWAQVFTQEYQQLIKNVKRGGQTVMDAYGSTNPAEFFAVATETFFEKPNLMAQEHPALYNQLKRYYQLEPREWIEIHLPRL